MVTANMDRVNPKVYRVFCVDTRHCPFSSADAVKTMSHYPQNCVLLCLTNDRAGRVVLGQFGHVPPRRRPPTRHSWLQLHLVEAGLSIGNRNRIMSGVKLLFRVTLRRRIWQLRSTTSAAPTAIRLPRFRALALLRRLASARVDGVVMQASENLVWGDFCQGCPGRAHPIISTSSFFVRPGQPRFFVPTHSCGTPARTGAVKDGA